MKTFIKLFLFVPVILLFSGCLEVKTIVNVNDDGSGTIEETILMSTEVVKMIKEFANSFAADSTQPHEDFELYDIEKIKEQAANFGEGVAYLSSEKISTDSQEGYKAVYSFADLNKITVDQNPNKQLPSFGEEGTMSEDEGKDFLTFQFTKGNPSELKIIMPKKEPAKEEEKENEVIQYN